MPLPAVIPLVGAIGAALAPWIMRFFAAKAVVLFTGFLIRMGFVLATNELVMDPLIDYVMAMWSSIPNQLQCWLALMGITKAASIYVSALTLLGFKRVFLAKSA